MEHRATPVTPQLHYKENLPWISKKQVGIISAMTTLPERKWITKIRKLAEANPNEVKIVREPEDNGGTIYAQVPATWLYVRKPKQVNMTEEQRAAAAERLKNARNSN